MRKLESDYKYLVILFVLNIIFGFLIVLLVDFFFKLELQNLKFILTLFIALVLMYGYKCLFYYDSNSIYFKNIYGFTLKTIKLKDIKGKKVIQNRIYFENIILLFGKKYNNTVSITLDLINSKKYSINGHFFSNKGLKEFIRLIK